MGILVNELLKAKSSKTTKEEFLENINKEFKIWKKLFILL